MGREQCDDMNDEAGDGCFQCKFDCNVNCQECTLGVCTSCKLGYWLIDQSCQSLCGDGMFLSKFEDCDDGNLSNLDGCDSTCLIESSW